MTMPTKCSGMEIDYMDGANVTVSCGEYRVNDGVLYTYAYRPGGFGYSSSSEPLSAYPLVNIRSFTPGRV